MPSFSFFVHNLSPLCFSLSDCLHLIPQPPVASPICQSGIPPLHPSPHCRSSRAALSHFSHGSAVEAAQVAACQEAFIGGPDTTSITSLLIFVQLSPFLFSYTQAKRIRQATNRRPPSPVKSGYFAGHGRESQHVFLSRPHEASSWTQSAHHLVGILQWAAQYTHICNLHGVVSSPTNANPSKCYSALQPPRMDAFTSPYSRPSASVSS